MMRVLSGLSGLGRIIDVSAASFPADPSLSGTRVLVVSTPAAYLSGFAPTIALLEGRPVPESGLVLGSAIEPIRIRRPDLSTLEVEPLGGFLKPGGRPYPGLDHPLPAFDLNYFYPMFDQLYRDHRPMARGERIPLGDVTAEIVSVTSDGRPERVAFRFATPLEDPSLRWLRWLDGIYVAFEPPGEGESVLLPAASVPFPPPAIRAQ